MVYRAALNPPNGSWQAAIVGRQRTEHADAPHPLGLVRTCRERPGTHAAEKTDEFAPPHLKLFIRADQASISLLRCRTWPMLQRISVQW